MIDMANVSDLRIAALVRRDTTMGKILTLTGPLLDRLLGIHAIRRFYEEHQLAGLAAGEFSERVVQGLGVQVNIKGEGLGAVPAEGPVLVVCNHPYGGMEAVIVMRELLKVRPDVKVLGNSALRVVRELQSVLIYTDPVNPGQKNLTSLRKSLAQLRGGGLLVVFPAGRVAYYRRELQCTTDHDWNRVVGHLVRHSDASVMPIYISGANSRLFLVLGHLYARLKMLMLPREMLKLNNQQVNFVTGLPIKHRVFDDLSVNQVSRLARLMTYLQGVEKSLPEARTNPASFAALADDPRPQDIEAEIASLPDRQILLKYREFMVCFGSQKQLPATVHEIARQRERTFRLYDEGSGEPIDTDGFDASYVQLFIWDTQRQALMGAYRMGRTDELRQSGGVYLDAMFDFDDAFYADNPASLEMGRSFVTPEYQKNYYSLHLLWRGIGAYLRLHPQYGRLYGTVSLSRQYDLRSICVMCEALIEPSKWVTPKWSLDTDLGPEWANYWNHAGTVKLDQVSTIVRSLEKDSKDIPILLRHYYKLDAKFLAVGVDPNFNHTPGLLLSVSIDGLPERKRKSYISPSS